MVKTLTHQKHPSVSLHKTLNAIGRSSKLYPMALLSTGPRRSSLIAGDNQKMTFVPEGDVYRLITHSRLPLVERFERRGFGDVLPSIRKTGIYALLAIHVGKVAKRIE